MARQTVHLEPGDEPATGKGDTVGRRREEEERRRTWEVTERGGWVLERDERA